MELVLQNLLQTVSIHISQVQLNIIELWQDGTDISVREVQHVAASLQVLETMCLVRKMLQDLKFIHSIYGN